MDNESDGKGMSGVKSVPEVFLTRLSATKIPLQKFVDDLFNVIFTPNEGITALPHCVKYLMDFLDSEAARLQISDPEVGQYFNINQSNAGLLILINSI